MGNSYKKNHYMPISIIEGWLSTDVDGNEGVWVYEIHKKNKYFSRKNDKSKYNFAVVNNLYVYHSNNIRITKIEEWFSKTEFNLNEFIKILKNWDGETTDEFIKKIMQKWDGAIKGILGLKIRSRFVVETFIKQAPKIINEKNLLKDKPNIENFCITNIQKNINFFYEKFKRANLGFFAHPPEKVK